MAFFEQTENLALSRDRFKCGRDALMRDLAELRPKPDDFSLDTFHFPSPTMFLYYTSATTSYYFTAVLQYVLLRSG